MMHPQYTPNHIANYRRRVQHGLECWPWAGRCDADGYGRYSIWANGRAWVLGAHRMAWELAFGPIPAGMMVCHSCDNPGCVRPDHLFLGTAADNNRDMHTKGRGQHGDTHSGRLRPETRPRGEQHGRAKLTATTVLAIRDELANGAKGKDIADRLGISTTTVSCIRLRKIWRHI